jgi:hypothetical protein
MTDTATFLPGNRLKSLAELNPMIGEKVRLEVGTPRQRFTVQLIGLKKNQSLLVTRPKLTSPGLLHAGTRFTARLVKPGYCRCNRNPFPTGTSPTRNRSS